MVKSIDTSHASIDSLTAGRRSTDMTLFMRSLMESVDQPLIVRCVVQEAISDPASLTQEKRDRLKARFGSRLDLLDTAPRNSIIAVPARGVGEMMNHSIVLYPFFSHNASPVKVGEHIWAIFEVQETRELGYWMSRIVENRLVDDPNHTHGDRRFLVNVGRATLRERASGEQIMDPTPGFDNGMGIPETFSVAQDDGDNPYEVLNDNSDGAKVSTAEPVPRFRKRPGDHVFEGSHNTLIVMGQDRNGAPVKLDPEGNVIGYPDDDETEGAGMIDIVTGRGQADLTSPLEIENTRGNLETDKNPFAKGEQEKLEEGDPDYVNDLSRILIAMKTGIDSKFRLFDGVPGLLAESDEIAPAVGLRSDQIRLVCRQDIKIVLVPPEADVDDANTLGQFASITIKKTGDIVAVPSSEGFIKLGGDSADRAVLCTDFPVTTQDGRVQQVPEGQEAIATTMGGLVPGPAAGLGQYAPKILVVGD